MKMKSVYGKRWPVAVVGMGSELHDEAPLDMVEENQVERMMKDQCEEIIQREGVCPANEICDTCFVRKYGQVKYGQVRKCSPTYAVELAKKMLEGFKCVERERAGIDIEEENRRLREMCKRYLRMLKVENVEEGLEKDLNDPTMWS